MILQKRETSCFGQPMFEVTLNLPTTAEEFEEALSAEGLRPASMDDFPPDSELPVWYGIMEPENEEADNYHGVPGLTGNGGPYLGKKEGRMFLVLAVSTETKAAAAS